MVNNPKTGRTAVAVINICDTSKVKYWVGNLALMAGSYDFQGDFTVKTEDVEMSGELTEDRKLEGFKGIATA